MALLGTPARPRQEGRRHQSKLAGIVRKVGKFATFRRKVVNLLLFLLKRVKSTLNSPNTELLLSEWPKGHYGPFLTRLAGGPVFPRLNITVLGCFGAK